MFCSYASGLVNAIASLVLGWGVDRYNWPRTYVLAAANLLLSGMYILEVSLNTVRKILPKQDVPLCVIMVSFSSEDFG